MAATGPRRILDLDTKPQALWKRFQSDVAYLYGGKICEWKKVGCVLCIAEDESSTIHQTLMDEDGYAICMTHGPLDKVPYKTVRTYECKIGSKTIKGTCVRDTVVFIPQDIQGDEREDLIAELVEEARDMEVEDFNDCQDLNQNGGENAL